MKVQQPHFVPEMSLQCTVFREFLRDLFGGLTAQAALRPDSGHFREFPFRIVTERALLALDLGALDIRL